MNSASNLQELLIIITHTNMFFLGMFVFKEERLNVSICLNCSVIKIIKRKLCCLIILILTYTWYLGVYIIKSNFYLVEFKFMLKYFSRN